MENECDGLLLDREGDEDIERACRRVAAWRAGDFVFCESCLIDELRAGSLRRVPISALPATDDSAPRTTARHTPRRGPSRIARGLIVVRSRSRLLVVAIETQTDAEEVK